jgi:hypothetical protein
MRKYPGAVIASAVGRAAGYVQDDRGVGVRVPVELRIFTSPCRPDMFCGPPDLLNRYRGIFPWGLKRPKRETDHSPPTTAEVKKKWVYTFTPPLSLHGAVLI